jgi:hypothetical protein
MVVQVPARSVAEEGPGGVTSKIGGIGDLSIDDESEGWINGRTWSG